uniref:Ionotropic glutamate receptor C-terminal domain-containing protein n=1 Tax=Rhodnius prolixus TaxID=13249 RepID=A0A0H2UI52_RHOPR
MSIIATSTKHGWIIWFYFVGIVKCANVDLVDQQRQIIFNYFELTNIETINLITCWNIREKYAMLQESSEKGLRVSFSFESMKPWPEFRRGGVLDLGCPFTEYYLTRISAEKMFGIHTEWLLIDVTDNTDDNHVEGQIYESNGVLRASNSYSLPGSCVRLVQIMTNSKMAFYFNMYRVTMREPMQFQLDWSGSIDDLPSLLTPCSNYNRSNFGGATLNAAVVVEFPHLFEGFDSMLHMDVDIWPKSHYPITILFAEQLNFRINFTVVPSFGWLVNGTDFDGMIGMLQREEAEIGATGSFMRGDRMNAAQYTTDTFEPRSAVLFKQPPLSSAYNIFLLPFSRLVWIACAILSLLVSLILAIEFVLTKYKSVRAYEQQNVELADLITMVLSAACQQGTELIPISMPARITVFLFSLAAFFLYTSYSANIVALLQSTAPVLKSLEDITNSHLGIKIQDLRYNKKFFKETADTNIINLFQRKVEPFGDEVYCLPEEGMRHMRSGKFAFLVEANVGYKIISNTFEEMEKCGLGEMKMFFNPKLSIPLVKRSGHREHITRMITKQRETGLLERIRLYWLPHKPLCESKSSVFISVGIADFLPALHVFLYGAAITVGVFIFESAFCYGKKIYVLKKSQLKNVRKVIPSYKNVH